MDDIGRKIDKKLALGVRSLVWVGFMSIFGTALRHDLHAELWGELHGSLLMIKTIDLVGLKAARRQNTLREEQDERAWW